ncbi:MAG: AsmA family protein [Rubrivivax sp.]
MTRPLKLVLLSFLALLALLLVALGIFVATFDANAYKSLAIDRVQQQYRRTLAIPGDLKLMLFPRFGVQAGEVSLSEAGSAQTFAALKSARVSLALWPLLSRRVEVDRIAIDGLVLRVERKADGHTSIDDLLGMPAAAPAPAGSAAASPSAPLAVDVAGIALMNANLVFDDRQGGRRVELGNAGIEIGHLAPGRPADVEFKGRLRMDAPSTDAQLALKTTLQFDAEPRRFSLTKLDAEVDGRLAGMAGTKVALRGNVDLVPEPMALKASGLELAFKSGSPALEAKLTVPALEGDAATLRLPAFSATATLPNPKGGTIPFKGDGKATLRLGAKPGLDAQLAGSFDESRIEAKFQLPTFSPLALHFDVGIDRLDLDRYRKTETAAAPAATTASAPEAPLDFSALRTLNASGSLRVGALQVMNLKTTNLKTELHAAGGRVALDPLALELYQGSASGSLVLNATTPPRVAINERLANISLGPLLHDLLGKAPMIEGRGSVALDVQAQGTTVTAMKKALTGSARAELRDGAVKGFNIGQAIREAKSKLKGEDSTGTPSQSTDFSELTASFTVANGVAHNEDLLAKSPLLRVGGAGDVDLGESRLDYLVKATVVDSLKGQGGAELDALRGQTIPVRLKGPFSAIAVKVDFGAMVSGATKQKVEEAKDKVEQKAKEKAKEKLKGLFGR